MKLSVSDSQMILKGTVRKIIFRCVSGRHRERSGLFHVYRWTRCHDPLPKGTSGESANNVHIGFLALLILFVKIHKAIFIWRENCYDLKKCI